MSANERRPSPDDYKIGIICAKTIESDSVIGLFEKFWSGSGYGPYPRARGDLNSYDMGRIAGHNVVLAYMPDESMGKVDAATTAGDLRKTFDRIELCLVVGICGAVPKIDHGKTDIILGDVIISTLVVQYDLGRQYSNKLDSKDTLGLPNTMIRRFFAKIKGRERRQHMTTETTQIAKELLDKPGFEVQAYPGRKYDILYKSEHRHKHRMPEQCEICKNCKSKDHDVCQEALMLTCEQLRCASIKDAYDTRGRVTALGDDSTPPDLRIHFGPVASGDSVMKSSDHRDELAKKTKIIAYEMERAGARDTLPTIVIKGVCDYADSHKNDRFQGYAAAVAAACVKAFLTEWTLEEERAPQPIMESVHHPEVEKLLPSGIETGDHSPSLSQPE